MKFRIGTTLAISGLIAVTICGAVITSGPRPTAEAASAGFTAIVDAALAKFGGIDAVEQRADEYDRAVSVSIPLAEAGLTEAAYRDLAAQGSNVVIPCESASTAGAEVNAILALAGGEATAVPCGGFNPDAPAVRVDFGPGTPIAASSLSTDEKARLTAAEFKDAGPCQGSNGLLSEAIATVGGSSWICGRTN
jgi:hypothetical protein